LGFASAQLDNTAFHARVEYPAPLCIGETGTIQLTIESFPDLLPDNQTSYRFSPELAVGWQVSAPDSSVQLDGGSFGTPLSNDDPEIRTSELSVSCDGGTGTVVRIFEFAFPVVDVVDGVPGARFYHHIE